MSSRLEKLVDRSRSFLKDVSPKAFAADAAIAFGVLMGYGCSSSNDMIRESQDSQPANPPMIIQNTADSSRFFIPDSATAARGVTRQIVIDKEVSVDVKEDLEIPDKNNTWDRLEFIKYDTIDGERCVVLKQNEKDKKGFMYTRYDQIFNYLNLDPAILMQEKEIKRIIRMNAKYQDNTVLNDDEIKIIPRTDKSGAGLYDIIITDTEKYPRRFSTKKDSKYAEAKKGHKLIQLDQLVVLPEKDLKKRFRLEFNRTERADTTYSKMQALPEAETPNPRQGFTLGIGAGYSANFDKVIPEAFIGYDGIPLGFTEMDINAGVGYMIPFSTRGKDSLWTGPFGFTRQKFDDEYNHANVFLDISFGGDFKLGGRIDYNMDKTKTESSVDELLRDFKGNIRKTRTGEIQPSKFYNNEYFSGGPTANLYLGKGVKITGSGSYAHGQKPYHAIGISQTF
jgi:hypothetical protein